MSQLQHSTPAAAGLPVAGGDAQQYLVFALYDEAFAIGIRNIKEIIEYGHLTEVPMMPEVVRGVINLRGAVVPVADLAVRFGRARTVVGRRTCIVIVEVESEPGQFQVIGILVDAVNEVLEIPPQDIEPPPAFGTHIRSDFVAGMGKISGKFVIILELKRLLSLEELASVTGQPALADAAKAGDKPLLAS
ncbi:MAG TPA: chemotaxis protein CheW [Rhodocyclaceae bacterium]|nr:chemotaxis protein CheW [Rhodocyclaceae bacterium]